MPRIFDNIELPLLPALRDTIKLSYRVDFCVGYFNFRGWRRIGDLIEAYIGNQGACCRLLVGMQSLPAIARDPIFPIAFPKPLSFPRKLPQLTPRLTLRKLSKSSMH